MAKASKSLKPAGKPAPGRGKPTLRAIKGGKAVPAKASAKPPASKPAGPSRALSSRRRRWPTMPR